jgi:energy-converting hydrogenase Eha subunit E
MRDEKGTDDRFFPWLKRTFGFAPQPPDDSRPKGLEEGLLIWLPIIVVMSFFITVVAGLGGGPDETLLGRVLRRLLPVLGVSLMFLVSPPQWVRRLAIVAWIAGAILATRNM